jgi:MBG domain (YGX type)/Bacterial Ig-like domain (group 3)/Beta-propeller repeat
MSSQYRSKDHLKLTARIACGAILVAGLAAGSHWHRAAKAAGAWTVQPTPTSSAQAVQSSFAPPPLPQPVSHVSKLTPAPKSASSPAVSSESRARVMKTYAALPMMFEANNGQTDSRVKFLSHAPGYTLFLTDKEAVLSLSADSPALASPHQQPEGHGFERVEARGAPKPARVVRLKFVDGSTPAIVGRDQLPSKTNYLIGNNPKQWHINVPNYSAVEYRGIYSGVDAVFHGDNQRLEFDFDIAPGVDPHAIAMEVNGARRIRLNQAGDIVFGMGGTRDVVLGKPRIYQDSPEGRREIAGNYVLSSGNRIAFQLGRYDHGRTLTIDPVVDYSSYLGGGSSQESYANAIAVDVYGFAYVVGTAGAGTVPFPTTPGSYNPGPVPTTANFPFISKLKVDGSGLVYSTYFGGDNAGFGSDQIFAVAADSSGSAYFGGISGSYDNTPTTPGAFMPVRPPGPRATIPEVPVPFVAKLSADGSTLVYSTFLDGTAQNASDDVLGIAVDLSGSAYVTGITTAQDFPTTPGAFQTVFKASIDIGTAFVTKLSADGSSLVYSTYLGGSTGEDGSGSTFGNGAIAVDASGSAYVTGNTLSSDFPTTAGAYNTTCNSPCDDAFVTKLNPTGTGLVYSTLLGGTGNKYSVGFGIAVDSSGSAFVGGKTTFTNFPVTSNVVQSAAGPGFITKLTADGTGLVYSSYFNGYVDSVAVGADDSAVIFGLGNTSFAFETTAGAFYLSPCTTGPTISSCFYDFVSKLTADGSGLIFSSPFGANHECCSAVGALDLAGNAYIAGSTSSLSFPTTAGSFEPTVPSTYTGFTPFVAEISFVGPPFATFSPMQLDFGDVNENTAMALPLTVTNTGAQPLTLDLVFLGIPLPPGFSYTQVVCGGVTEPLPLPVPLIVNAGADNACTFTVQFDPATAGSFSGGLAFVDNAAPGESNLTSTVFNGGPYGQVVTLSGTGVAPGPPPTPDFSISASPGSQTVTAGNTTTFTATLSAINGFIGAINLSASGLPSGATASFSPNSVTTSGNSTVTISAASSSTTGGPFTITITGTSGSLTESTTVSLTINASGGGSSGTPACGCSKTGPYVAPNPGSQPAATSSEYAVSTYPNPPGNSAFNLIVTNSTGTQLFNQALAAGTTWGFSPDGTHLETDSVSGGEETVSVYNLAGSNFPVSNPLFSVIANASSSRIYFSPSGQYLAYTALTGSSFATLQIYNVLTGKKVYENDFSFQTVPGSGEDTYGVVGVWGFSPDKPETSFVYSYLNGQNSVQWELVHLEQPPTSNTNGTAKTVSLTNITSAFWQFSPCGDAVAIVLQTNPSFQEIQLLRTYDGTQLSDTSGIPVGTMTLTSTSTEQMATDSAASQPYDLADNSTVNLGCSAENTPPGSNVTVQPAATWTGSGNAPAGSLPAPVTLTFPSVNSPGGQITLSESNTGAAPPDGFALGNLPVYYDLEEIPSTLSYTAPITICINFTGISLTGQPALFHIVNGVSTPLTEISVDTTNHIVCAQTPSLSPFAVFEAAGPVSTSTALTSSLSSSVDGQAITLTAQITPSLVGTPTGTVTFSDGATVLGTGPLNGSGSASISTSLLPAGTDSITAVYSGDTYFGGSTSSALALTVTPAPLTVTANSVSRQYGASDPTFTAAYSGFVNGDGPGALSGTLTCTAGDAVSSPVGTYAINCSGLSSSNYSITFLPGTLSITPAPLTITANNASKIYGAANPAFSATDTGFVNGDTAAVLSGALSCTSAAAVSSPVGSYPINCSGVSSSNYAITFVPGALTVTPAALTIAANNATRLYGGANPAFTASSSGFVNGDNASVLIGVLSCSTAATSASPVGTYPVTCSGQSAANYSITYVPGQLSVTPAPLTITANNVSRPYGQANPSSFGVTYSGFVNGDTSSSLSGALSCTTTAAQSSPVGTYPITCMGLTSSNYAITFVPGTLTVIKEVLSITAKFVSIAQASNGNYVVTIAVTNNGDITANRVASGIMIGNLVIPGGSLGDKADISSAPALNVAPGATADITLVFPASAGKPLTTRELLAYGFATATNPNGTPVLPALWVLQPAPTQVTLP